MGKIQFTVEEITELAKRNDFLPDIIEVIYSNNDEIDFIIKTPVLIIKRTIKVHTKFQKYENGLLYFSHNRKIPRFIIEKWIDPTKNIDWIEIKRTEIIINLNSIIESTMQGITISKLHFENSNVVIETK